MWTDGKLWRGAVLSALRSLPLGEKGRDNYGETTTSRKDDRSGRSPNP